MSEIATVGLGLAKNVFQVHGADASGQATTVLTEGAGSARHVRRDALRCCLR